MNFDINHFKRAVKEWMRTHASGSIEELADYCEELIPAPLYPSHEWLVQQTLGWYEHVLSQRAESQLED